MSEAAFTEEQLCGEAFARYLAGPARVEGEMRFLWQVFKAGWESGQEKDWRRTVGMIPADDAAMREIDAEGARLRREEG